MAVQPHVLARCLAYSGACAAHQHKGEPRTGPALIVRVANGPDMVLEYSQPGPVGPQRVQALSVFVVLCQPDKQVTALVCMVSSLP